MKHVVVLAVALCCGLVLAAAASASHGKGHKQKVDPTFACDGVTCSYFADGLAPGEQVSARFEYLAVDGFHGCNTGFGNDNADASGNYTLAFSEVRLLGCGLPPVLPGVMHAWLATDSNDWSSPVIAGTEITVSVG